jgi:hypothetical protein
MRVTTYFKEGPMENPILTHRQWKLVTALVSIFLLWLSVVTYA